MLDSQSTFNRQYQFIPSDRVYCKSKPILVVDNEKIIRTVFEGIMKPKGLSYFLVNGGDDAVETYKSKLPGLVFMDYKMPNGTGIDAICDIREYELDNDITSIPIVLMSGCDPCEFSDLDCFMYDVFLRKPFGKPDIESVLDKYPHTRP